VRGVSRQTGTGIPRDKTDEPLCTGHAARINIQASTRGQRHGDKEADVDTGIQESTRTFAFGFPVNGEKKLNNPPVCIWGCARK